MGFSRQKYCSELPCPTPEDLPDPGIKPTSLASSTLAGGLFTTSATWETQRASRKSEVTKDIALRSASATLTADKQAGSQQARGAPILCCFKGKMAESDEGWASY